MNARKFGARGLAVLAAAVFGIAAAPADIRFGVCDWTLGKSGDPAALESAAKLGFEGIQVSLVPMGDSLVLRDKEARKAYRAAMEKTGLAIASFCVGDLNDVPLHKEPRAEKWLSEGIDVAREMNVGVILVPFFGPADLKDDPAGEKAVIAAFRRLVPKAEKSGVVLAIESTLSGPVHRRIIEAVGSPALRVYYDTANSLGGGYDINAEIRDLGPLIREIHAKDDKDLYGKGNVDFQAVRDSMAAAGYSGWLVLEGSKYPLGREKSLAYDLEYLRGVFGR